MVALGDLFKGDDAALSLELDRVRTRAEELTVVWRSRLPEASSSELREFFVAYEALLADALPAEKRTLIAQKLEDSFASVFRKQAFYRFEHEIYVHRQERGELSIEEFGDAYQRHSQVMFGDGLRLTENHAWWWSPILHFCHYRFYVFMYAIGEVLANAFSGKAEQVGRSKSWRPKRFDAYSPKMFASINGLEPSLASRCFL